MDVPRQGQIAESGRVNQKRRTRAAIVEAAKELLSGGTTPTVAQAAEAAMVSRTTAYRYFPTQESLLLEVTVNLDVGEIEELVGRPLDGEPAVDRVLEVLRALNRHVVDEEVQYRTLTRLYLDLWLSAVTAGEPAPIVREGRRYRWITGTLDALEPPLPAGEERRLAAALSVLAGPEAIAVLRDVAQLSGEEAVEVADWAARTLLEAATGGDARPPEG